MENILTNRQNWVLNYLTEYKRQYCDGWVSPSQVGNQYGIAVLDKKGLHSSTGSPILKELVEKGLVERNKKGHYRILETKFKTT